MSAKILVLFKLAPWIVLLTGITVTYLLHRAASDSLNKAYKTNFDYEVKATIDRIMHRLYTNEQILLGVKGLFVASEAVSRKEFHDYVTQHELQSNYPGIQSIGFATIIPSKELINHTTKVRKEGFRQYKVFPDGEREIYTPIVYVEPFVGRNLRAFGFDTTSNPVRRTAMLQARDSGATVMTGAVRLAQETNQNEQAGFILYLPIYRNGSPHETEAERRANIIGWVNSAFRMNDLMQKILSEFSSSSSSIEFQIFDGGQVAPETLMYQSFGKDYSPLPKHAPYSFQATRQLHIFGHDWTIKLFSQNIFSKTDQEKLNIITLSGGLLSALLSLVMWQLINARKQALALANKMTKELRGSERRTRAALAETQQQWNLINEHAILVTTNTEGRITYANDKFCQLSGYQMEELIGEYYQSLNSEQHPDECFKGLFANIASGMIWHGEICKRAKNGDSFWLLTTVAPFLDESGKLASYTIIQADITPLKQAENQLKEALSDKEALLKEVYHRVKNNLQVVSSLMNLQLYTVKNEEMIVTLKESINRIKSMVLIHESLYQTTNLAHINFHDYTQNLVNHLLHVYGAPEDKIKIQLDIDTLAMDADTAIPCGLIINELVSNALKYAFPDGRQGVISITFKAQEDKYSLTVTDNGVGFPDGFDINTSQTLGLQLVSSLSNQLMGTMTMDRANGASILIRFRPIIA